MSATATELRFEYGVLSHIGQKREENQDAFSIVVDHDQGLFMVCDGMGGASGGALASAMVSRAFSEGWSRQAVAHPVDAVRSIVTSSNREIYSLGKRNPALEGMGTTVSGLVLNSDMLLICNVGDSRVYRLRGNSIAQLTQDHTLVGELLESGALTPEQAEQSPVSHMLTRSVGPAIDINVDCYLFEEPPRNGDVYVICSDGLYNSISSAEIGFVLGEYKLHDALEHLVGLANMRGGSDNITGIVIECISGFRDAEEIHTGADNDNNTAKKGTRKIVAVDLAEDAAQETFSRVRKEVDISADVLWGAHRNTQTTEKSNTQQARPTSRTIPQQRLTLLQRAIVVCAVVFVATVAWAFWMSNQRESRRGVPVYENRIEKQILETEKDDSKEMRSLTKELRPEAEQRRRALIERLETIDTAAQPQAERIERRKVWLRSAQDRIAQQQELFNAPVDPKLIEEQKKLKADQRAIEEKRVTVEREIQSLSSTLEGWRNRLLNIDEVDTVNATAELATVSPDIAKKKKEFEAATWKYLQTLEEQRVDPQNESIAKEIDALVVQRNKALEELAATARTFIEDTIAKNARERGLLQIERDELKEREGAILSELEYGEVRLSGDAVRKATLSENLGLKRRSIERELAQLGKSSDNAPRNDSTSSIQ
jgi:serine/threonine protein phosphatase PrpC